MLRGGAVVKELSVCFDSRLDLRLFLLYSPRTIFEVRRQKRVLIQKYAGAVSPP